MIYIMISNDLTKWCSVYVKKNRNKKSKWNVYSARYGTSFSISL